MEIAIERAMHRRQSLPRLWLMTDERQGDALWNSIDALPRGAGIVVRHYSLTIGHRRALVKAILRRARRRRQIVLVAESEGARHPRQCGYGGNALGWHARASCKGDGSARPRGRHTASAHDLLEVRAAERGGAALVFLSPIHPTRSHPGVRTLGRVRFGFILRVSRIPVVALGGVTPRRGAALMRMGAHGWAAIDAWQTPADQKRKAVPM